MKQQSTASKTTTRGLCAVVVVPPFIAEDIDFSSFGEAMREDSHIEKVAFGYFIDVATFDMIQPLFSRDCSKPLTH
jgi:hypothetical protein